MKFPPQRRVTQTAFHLNGQKRLGTHEGVGVLAYAIPSRRAAAIRWTALYALHPAAWGAALEDIAANVTQFFGQALTVIAQFIGHIEFRVCNPDHPSALRGAAQLNRFPGHAQPYRHLGAHCGKAEVRLQRTGYEPAVWPPS